MLVGDELVYRRGFGQSMAEVEGSAKILSITAKGQFKVEIQSRGKTAAPSKVFDSLNALENAIVDLDGRVAKSKRPNGNAWKSFEQKREGRSRGKMWEVRMTEWEKRESARLSAEDCASNEDSVDASKSRKGKGKAKSKA
ncbi:hypothetical protein HDU93_009780 [Gonapodya sp. JEL0774]|nr:hypothetical protein HDU93_009780 [Gonapodya sp. JEL0774]